jgi:hypothetical protein
MGFFFHHGSDSVNNFTWEISNILQLDDQTIKFLEKQNQSRLTICQVICQKQTYDLVNFDKGLV